jgi:eukaryotic-like serine/threonine-protein kinase
MLDLMSLALRDHILWRRIEDHLDRALDLEPEERDQWLADLAATQPENATVLRELLGIRATLDRHGFLESAPLTRASLEELVRRSEAGEQIRGYTLERHIGSGGMGEVWLASRSDGRFEGQFAIKFLDHSATQPELAKRFRHEGRLLARLEHPNIARLIDAGATDDGRQFLVLEYADGERIDHYCDSRQLDLKARVSLFLGVVDAVAHAHGHLIIHRDLKPSNVLVRRDGTVKLLDFGIAKLLSTERIADGDAHTRVEEIVLTPEYAAPEQLLGEVPTTAMDVYQLGLLLFVLLTGRHPLQCVGSRAERIKTVLEEEAPLASQCVQGRLQRELRGDLDNIIAMALRRNPVERYSTADQLAEDLRRYLARKPVAARQNTFGYVAARFVRRHRRSVALAALIVVMLVGAIVVTSIQMAEVQWQRDVARSQARRAEATDHFLELLMLSDLGPTQRTRTFHERLELGVELIEKHYSGNDPLFAGRMLVELGGHFRENDETNRADALYARAYDIGRQHHDAELMAAAQCARARGDAGAGVSEGVVQRLEEALQLLAQLRDPDATLQAECLRARAIIELQSSRIGAAEALLRQAMSVLESAGNTNGGIYVSVLTDLGNIYLVSNRPRDDLRMMQLAGEIEDRNGRGGTITRLATRHNAAVALQAMGEVRAALAELEIILRRWRVLDNAGEEPIADLRNYAKMLTRMARPEEAARMLDSALKGARSAGNHTVLAYVLSTMGSAYTDLSRWDEADAALREAASLSAGSDRSLRTQVESSRARLELSRGNLAVAHQHSELALQNAGYGAANPDRMLKSALLIAAQIALAQHAGAEAERFAREALALSEPVARDPNSSADVGEALLRIAQARDLSGSPAADAKALLTRAVQCLSNGLRPDHPLTVEARNTLVRVSG